MSHVKTNFSTENYVTPLHVISNTFKLSKWKVSHTISSDKLRDFPLRLFFLFLFFIFAFGMYIFTDTSGHILMQHFKTNIRNIKIWPSSENAVHTIAFSNFSPTCCQRKKGLFVFKKYSACFQETKKPESMVWRLVYRKYFCFLPLETICFLNIVMRHIFQKSL